MVGYGATFTISYMLERCQIYDRVFLLYTRTSMQQRDRHVKHLASGCLAIIDKPW
jgi:hypothetical protein